MATKEEIQKERKKKRQTVRLKAFLVSVVGVLLLLAFFLVLRFLAPANTPVLPAPTDISCDGYTLEWSKVSNAASYEVEVGGDIRTSKENKIYLKYADNGKTLRIRAVDENGNVSAYSEEFIVYYSQEFLDETPMVVYTLAEVEHEDLEFNYEGMPIELPEPDYSEYGYRFICWQLYEDDDFIPVTEPFIRSGDVLLYALVEPLQY